MRSFVGKLALALLGLVGLGMLVYGMVLRVTSMHAVTTGGLASEYSVAASTPLMSFGTVIFGGVACWLHDSFKKCRRKLG